MTISKIFTIQNVLKFYQNISSADSALKIEYTSITALLNYCTKIGFVLQYPVSHKPSTFKSEYMLTNFLVAYKITFSN